MVISLNTQDKVNYWISLSEYDLETAKAMFKSERFLYVGFICHQVIEKLLKAVYVKNNNEIPPRIHDLIKLSKKSDIYHKLTEEQRDFLEYLGPLNIDTRYPQDIKKATKLINKKGSKIIVDKTREMSTWINQRLSK